MEYLLLSHGKSGYSNATRYVLHTLQSSCYQGPQSIFKVVICTVCIYYSVVVQLFYFTYTEMRTNTSRNAKCRNEFCDYLLTYLLTYLGLVSYGSAIKEYEGLHQGSP
jgi:hypothetical protein